MRVRRGSWYSRLAISTCSWPSAVRARWPKMSRISIVRSQTATRSSSAAERLRACRGVSSESKITVSTDGGSSGSRQSVSRSSSASSSHTEKSDENAEALVDGSSDDADASSSSKKAASGSSSSSSSSALASALVASEGSPHARLSSPSFPFPTYVPGCGARRRWVTVPTTSSPAVSASCASSASDASMPYWSALSSPFCPPTPTRSTRSFVGSQPHMSSRTSAAAFMSASTLRSMSSSQEGASPSREALKARADRRRATRDARQGRVLVEDAPLAWPAARCDGVGDAVGAERVAVHCAAAEVAMRAFWCDSESA